MGLSCLIDPTAPVVIDASTVINLNATACGPRILKAISILLSLLTSCRENSSKTAAMVAMTGNWSPSLLRQVLSPLRNLTISPSSHFEDLVIGRGDATLDDGEAATIAYGVEKGAITLIDERKAMRICGERYPRLTVGDS